MADGAEVLACLLGHCEHGEPLPIEARSHLAAAIRRCALTGDSLDTCLGVSAPGRRTLQTRIATQIRNEFLIIAVAVVALDETLSMWQRCRRLAPLLDRFQTTNWKKTRYQDAPPANWPLWQKCAWHAASTDVALPTSERQLYDAVRGAGVYSPHERGVKLLASKL